MFSAIEITEVEDVYAQDSHPKICCNLRYCFCCGNELVGRSLIPLLCRGCGNALRGEWSDEVKQGIRGATRSWRGVDLE